MFLGGHFFTSEQIGVTIRTCDLNPNSRLLIAIWQELWVAYEGLQVVYLAGKSFEVEARQVEGDRTS